MSEFKLVSVVHDNTMNTAIITQLLVLEDVPCTIHKLHRAIHFGLKCNVISRMLVSAARFVTHFRHSTIATNALEKQQEAMKMLKHSLMQTR